MNSQVRGIFETPTLRYAYAKPGERYFYNISTTLRTHMVLKIIRKKFSTTYAHQNYSLWVIRLRKTEKTFYCKNTVLQTLRRRSAAWVFRIDLELQWRPSSIIELSNELLRNPIWSSGPILRRPDGNRPILGECFKIVPTCIRPIYYWTQFRLDH